MCLSVTLLTSELPAEPQDKPPPPWTPIQFWGEGRLVACVYVHVPVHECMCKKHATACVWRSKGNLRCQPSPFTLFTAAFSRLAPPAHHRSSRSQYYCVQLYVSSGDPSSSRQSFITEPSSQPTLSVLTDTHQVSPICKEGSWGSL